MLLRSSTKSRASLKLSIEDQCKRGIKMNELPNELICMIFSHLDLIDLIDNCRLVSKRWLALVDSIKFKELIITNLENVYFSNSWYTLEPINPKNFMFVHSSIDSMPTSRYITIKCNNFINLKRLKIEFNLLYLDLDQLNNFIQLEHLELDLSFKKNSTLYLPNLRVLYLYVYNQHAPPDLVIDADKLEVLCCNGLSKIKLIHPESIKFLDIDDRYLTLDSNFIQDLNGFSNLEVCRVNTYKSSDDASLLSKLPNCLKEFHFDYFDLNCKTTDLRIRYYRSILQDKINRGNSNLKIYIGGIELTNELLDSNGLELTGLKLYHTNYEKLTTLPQTRWIDYSDLLRNFDNVIPKDFFMKFNNIQRVEVDKMVNQNQLIWFLKGCHLLNVLIIDTKLEPLNFNQEFYNELPKIASLLSNLQLYGCLTDQIDYKFISEFKLLVNFDTDQHIPIQTAKYLIKNLRFLRTFEFDNEIKKNDRRQVIVRKIPRINEFFIDIQNEYRNGWIDQKLNDNDELDKFFDNQNNLV